MVDKKKIRVAATFVAGEVTRSLPESGFDVDEYSEEEMNEMHRQLRRIGNMLVKRAGRLARKYGIETVHSSSYDNSR